MNTENENFELVGRWLDGEEIDLTDAQRALADEITADAERVGPALDVSMPGGTLHRVGARVRQADAVRPRKRAWLRWAGAAAAAVIVVAVVWSLSRPGAPQTPTAPDLNGDRIVYINGGEFDPYAETSSEGWLTALALMGAEEEINELLLDEGNGSGTLFDPEPLDSWLDGNGWENSL